MLKVSQPAEPPHVLVLSPDTLNVAKALNNLRVPITKRQTRSTQTEPSAKDNLDICMQTAVISGGHINLQDLQYATPFLKAILWLWNIKQCSVTFTTILCKSALKCCQGVQRH